MNFRKISPKVILFAYLIISWVIVFLSALGAYEITLHNAKYYFIGGGIYQAVFWISFAVYLRKVYYKN